MKPVRQFFTTSPEHADRIGQGIAVRVTNFDSAARRQRFPRRQIAPLVAAQSLFQCGMSVHLTLTGLVGYRIAPTPALATVPFAAITLGAAVMSAPASFCVRKWGYRKAFLLGASAATLGVSCRRSPSLSTASPCSPWGLSLWGSTRGSPTTTGMPY